MMSRFVPVTITGVCPLRRRRGQRSDCFDIEILVPATTCPCSVPVDAPLRLQLGDGGIFHVLKPQVFLEVSLVYAHGHGHVSAAIQGSVCAAGEPLAAPPEVMTG